MSWKALEIIAGLASVFEESVSTLKPGRGRGEEAVYVWQRFHHIFTYSAKTNG